MQPAVQNPHVIWLTGLPGAGKSTIAGALLTELVKLGAKAEWLNGDRIRQAVSGIGFSAEAPGPHLQYMALFASRLEAHGIWVIADFVSPTIESRVHARAACHRFVEVYIATPLSVCESRDIRGLYKRARSGDIPNFTGVSAPYEPPENADVTVDAARMAPDRCAVRILESCVKR